MRGVVIALLCCAGCGRPPLPHASPQFGPDVERDIVVYDPGDDGRRWTLLDQTQDRSLLEPMFDREFVESGLALVEVAEGSFTLPRAPSRLYALQRSMAVTTLLVVENGMITRRAVVDGNVSIGPTLDLDGDGVDEVVLLTTSSTLRPFVETARLVRFGADGLVTLADFGRILETGCFGPAAGMRSWAVVHARLRRSGLRFVLQPKASVCEPGPSRRETQLRVW